MTATRGRILIVDDERELRAALCETLADEGYETTGAGDVPDAVRALAGREFDLILSDLMMPGGSGLDLLRHVRDTDPHQLLVIMTGQGSIHTAVEAMRLGAFDYVLKPFDLAFMLPVLDRALETRRLRAENSRLRAVVSRLTYEGPRFRMIGTSPAMLPVLRLIEKVAATDATVLVRGESGTGKELVARAVHHNSRRVGKPLITINCAALQESLLESELFGHEKGAFTGATQAKPGLIEVAEGGTLFIDEVAEMAPALQAKLLRVLEDGHYRRVGSTKDARADVRVVAATNKPLEEEQKAGRFREDLYYRLNVVTVPLPPLRDRREDIPLLVEHLLATRSVGTHRCQVHPAAAAALLRYRWPGNVRELANVLERAQILAEGHLITLDDLPAELLPSPAYTPAALADSMPSDGEVFDLGELERRVVRRAMSHTGGNKAQAAALLGVTRRTLYRLLERYAEPPANG
ncbi:MAG: sigma-54 dependent transcriptional regulator [Fimbriiglobus sp.]|jgi:DNA-binding NtrC family response regulator|nr:sigma-54 dependent transcriptional regulator [Fimbriiglobus sp.]